MMALVTPSGTVPGKLSTSLVALDLAQIASHHGTCVTALYIDLHIYRSL